MKLKRRVLTMSLLEALLLDPQRINTWVALRNDEVRGSGTQTDPYEMWIFRVFRGIFRWVELMGSWTARRRELLLKAAALLV